MSGGPSPESLPRAGWQPARADPPWSDAAEPDRAAWGWTVALVALILGVVLGGSLLDRSVPSPSIGEVLVGPGVTVVAAPGWFEPAGGEADGSQPTILQNGDVSLAIVAEPAAGARPRDLLEAIERAWRGDSAVSQVAFRAVADRGVAGLDGATVGYEAWLSSSGVPIDGEVVVAVGDIGTAVVFNCYAPQGDLGGALGDLELMVGSLRLGASG